MPSREVLSAKIHRATVTDADLHYDGSLTVDGLLLDISGMREFDKISVVDIDNGARLDTYVIRGKEGSGEICANGGAARLVKPGDKIIIIAYSIIEKDETLEPKIILVDGKNRPKNAASRSG